MTPQFRRGNMFDQSNGIIFVTANATLKSNGALVMGRGAAFGLKDKIAGIDRVFGKRIKEICGTGGKYHIIVDVKSGTGLFQVKYNWWEYADLELIRESTLRLARIAYATPDIQYHLNYPGIGNGRLDKKLVEEIINELPNNVTVWEKP